MEDKQKKFPEGHFIGMWTGIGIALFAGVGVPLSIAIGNNAFIGIGPAIGVAVGISIGTSIEAKKKKEGLIRPLNEREKILRKRNLTAGIILGTAGVMALLFFGLL